MNRIDYTTDRLQENADKINLVLRVRDVVGWSYLDAWADKRFGWLPPRDEVVQMATDVCPELIVVLAEQAGLNDEEFERYITAIIFLICLYQTNKDFHPLEDRTKLVESALYTTDPSALALLSRVQMEAEAVNR